MGLAIDTVSIYRTISTVADTAFNAATVAAGDSLTVRSFAPTASAKLEAMIGKLGASFGRFRVRSPMLHDNVQGIEWVPGEVAATYLFPREVAQGLISQDTLIAEIENLTASTTVAVALQIYYSDLLGAAARLHSSADILPMIKNLKPLIVAVTNSATAGVWTDTVITTTENLLHANQDYAVLGVVSDTAGVVAGIKGTETGNLRVCAPISLANLDQSEYFISQSDKHGTPHIPVFNSANKDSVYVSTLDNVASSTPNITLILAELVHNLTT